MIRRLFYHMDQLFESAYKNYTEEPSSDVWERINAGLDRDDVVRFKRKSRRWQMLALFLLLVMGTYFIFETTARTKRQSLPQAARHQKTLDPHAGFPAVLHAFTANGKKLLAVHYPKKPHSDKEASFRRPEIEIQKKNDAGNRPSDFSWTDQNARFSRLFVKLDSNQYPALTAIVPMPAADAGKKTGFRKTWTLTGSASIDMAEYRIDNDLPQADVKSMIEGRESHNASFSLAITAGVQFSKKWAVQSGLRYSNILIGIDPHEIYAIQPSGGKALYKYVTSSGYALIQPDFQTPGDSLQTSSARHHLVFISLPVMLKYLIGIGRWSLMPGIGIQANYLAKAAVKTVLQYGANTEVISIHQLTGKKSFYFSYIAETALSYRLHSKWSLNAVPSFQYGVTSITRGNAVNTFPYSFGLDFGLTYHF